MTNLPPPFNDGLFSKTQGVISSSAWRQWFGSLKTSVNTIITNITITGTGLVHIVNGVIQSAASLITNSDVAANANISESKLALNYPTHSNANDPTSDQKAALVGTGTPSAGNVYATADHNHQSGAGAAITEAAITLANNTTDDVSISKHGFAPLAPNDTSKFLRGDGTWAAAGGTTPTGTGYRHVTSGVEDAAAATGYLLTGKQTFGAGSGTYTPTAGTTAILVEVQAAGGGGGGASNFLPGTANGPSAGSGGAGGGYAKLWITSLAGSYSYAVGAGGAGGYGGYSGADGSAGGNSTFGSGPIITCNGGPGGYGSPCVPPSTPQITAQSKYGGTASGGDFNIPGMNSFHGWFLTAGNVYAGISGDGGNSILGSGGKSVYYSVHYGTDGGGYGAGGSGSVNYYNSGVYVNGGHGTDGIIIIWEFK